MVPAARVDAPTDRSRGVDLRVTGIAKDFGVYPALHGVDLDVRAGELVALLGPSGSGKTTLLRIIAGLELPDRGEVFFGSRNATHLRVQERRAGFVFQSYALFRHMSVFDNIAYGLTVRPRSLRPTRAAIRTRVAELLDLVQLSGYEARYPAQLSGGQRQRVALARALAIEPQVLLLDEPFGALDARVRKDLRRWLRDFHRRTGLTTIFVTHDQDEAMDLADRVAILNRGRIEQVGTPGELYDHPASPFVMSFIGETVAVDVVTSGGVARIGGQRIEAPGRDGRWRLYLRPHDIKLTDPRSGMLVGTVEGIRRTSAGHRLQVVIEDLATPIDIDVAEAPMRRGERVGLVLAPKSLMREDLEIAS